MPVPRFSGSGAPVVESIYLAIHHFEREIDLPKYSLLLAKTLYRDWIGIQSQPPRYPMREFNGHRAIDLSQYMRFADSQLLAIAVTEEEIKYNAGHFQATIHDLHTDDLLIEIL